MVAIAASGFGCGAVVMAAEKVLYSVGVIVWKKFSFGLTSGFVCTGGGKWLVADAVFVAI
jgi:hypothetical protein